MNREPVVLMYHGIGDFDSVRDPEHLFIPVHAFTGQMRYLQRTGYHVLSEEEYLEWLDGRPLQRRSVLLTFDDGYVSVLKHAAPLLAGLGIPAVCFVCPGLLGGQSTWMPEPARHELMDVSQLAELVAAGIALGVHGLDHTALEALSPGETDRHARGAAEVLHQRLGVRARTFAYPYGAHSATARQAVSAAGFEAAFAIYNAAGRWALPRVDINAVDTPRTFRLKLNPWYPRARRVVSAAPPVRRAVHTLAGRARR